MVFPEPKVEFVAIEETNVIATSGPAAEYCKKYGDNSLQEAQFCYTMLGEVDTKYEEFCYMVVGHEDTAYRPS